MKTGITGPWYPSGRWDDSVWADLIHMENWSIVSDIYILLRDLRGDASWK